MKKYSIFIFCTLILIGCMKKEFDEIDKVTREDRTQIRERMLEERRTNRMTSEMTSTETTYPIYNDGSYDWEVEYNEFTNVHHPYGYVVIRKITKKLLPEYDETEIWTIDYDAKNYIEEIHYNLKAKHRNGGYEESNVFLPTDEKFRSAFRTAEAIILAYAAQNYKNPVEMDNVIKAAARMKMRKFGLSRSE